MIFVDFFFRNIVLLFSVGIDIISFVEHILWEIVNGKYGEVE